MESLTEFDVQILNAFKNHRKIFSSGLANLVNEKKFTCLRSVSKLIRMGFIVKQKGVQIDGEKHERARLYKLSKETMWIQPDLFDAKTA